MAGKFLKVYSWMIFFTLPISGLHAQDLSAIPEGKNKIYCIGNIHFDNFEHYKDKPWFRNEIQLMETRLSNVYHYLVENRGITAILLESPILQQRQIMHYLAGDSICLKEHLDTTNWPAFYLEIQRLREIKEKHPNITFHCIDVSKSRDRHYFMTSLLFEAFSHFSNLNEHYLFLDNFGYQKYVKVWEGYSRIIDSLGETDLKTEYLQLLHEALDVKFFRLSKRRRVKKLVENFKVFYEQNPNLESAYMHLLLASYDGSRWGDDDKRELFIFEQIKKVKRENKNGNCLVELGKWHFKYEEKNNVLAMAKKDSLDVPVIKMYYSVFGDYLYKKIEVELSAQHENELYELYKDYFILF